MEFKQLKQELEALDYQQLREIEDKVRLLIVQAGAMMADMPDKLAEQLRSSKRFPTNLTGTATRLTDIKPGQKEQYTAIITDISQGGMGLRVPGSFVPCRLMDVQFYGKDKKLRKFYLEVVRMNKIEIKGEAWMELGCTIVDKEYANTLIEREQRVCKVKYKLQNKSNALILLAGERQNQEEKIILPLNTEGYQIRKMENIKQAVNTAKKLAAQLLIFSQGSRILREPDTLELIISMPPEVASLAIIDNENDKTGLYQAGIDECIVADSCDKFLLHAIERAMLNHAYHYESNISAGKALICGINTRSINLASYTLSDMGYKCQCISNMKNLDKFQLDWNNYDLIFIEYDINTAEDFRKIMEIAPANKIIAICKNCDDSRGAMACGAANYLTVPASQEDIKRIIESNCVKTQQ